MLVAYDGGAYHGWQIQPDVRTVEGELAQAARRMLNCGLEACKVQGASRTDAGVHALGQVAHLAYDVPSSLQAWDFVRGLNALTDPDICVVYAEPAPAGFHARHSARGKIYHYEIWNHRFVHPLLRDRTWQVSAPLDIEKMRAAGQKLVGEHDFAAFRAADCCQEGTVREMYRVEVFQDGAHVRVEVEGSAFLKNMVRIIAGTLVAVGCGQVRLDDIDTMLATGQRPLGGPTAPPQGLTLVEIFYPDFPWPHGTPQPGGPWGA